MSIPFIIDNEVKYQIAQAKIWAAQHPISKEIITAHIKNGTGVGNDRHYQVRIPLGFKFVFAYYQLDDTDYFVLSANSPREGRIPSPPAMQLIMDEFGFKQPLGTYEVLKEPIGPNHFAIKVV